MTSAAITLGLILVQGQAPVSTPSSSAGLDVAALLAPILSTGVVGALFLMLLFRIKVMPTYVYDDAKAEWANERERLIASHEAEVARLQADKTELKGGLKDAQSVYTEQVIPTLTRVLDSERELVELRRDEAAERRRSGGS